uniref:DNA polymerase delta subunit 3 n=1 Tax=Heliothis virescens TaxID=7102 RepID=A0A2A4JVJ8_HELVI
MEDKANLKAVQELILDEQKLVTYISVSKELCIHVNEAKSLLSQIVKDIRKSHPETILSVSYIISGLLSDNSGCLTVCPEGELDTLKKTFKIIFYEHVYCVSRGPNSVDNVALTAVNKFEDLTLCTGLIRANACIKRTDDEIGNLKSKNLPVFNEPKATSVRQNSKSAVKEVSKHDTVKETEVKIEPNIKLENPSPKKDTSNNKAISNKANTNKTASKGIAGFFSKVNGDSNKAKKPKVQEPEIKVEKDVATEAKTIETKTSPKTETNTSAKNGKDKVNNNKALTQIKKNAKVDKKRKRLLHVSDSESETEDNDPFKSEMDVDQDSEDEIPPTPTVNTVKITSGIVNPKKRRKIVDKTYTDEDGYILTKKEEVYESFSENEEETKENSNQIKENGIQEKTSAKEKSVQKPIKTESSPPESKSKKKKISPPQKGKQQTINSFFKKA